MNPLKQSIINKIKSNGPISFETFMKSALYHPEYGYYTRNSANIGKAGDFYTSSHLHPIFGTMLGRQMLEMWELMGMPLNFEIVEMGAGAGWLAKDMMEYLKKSEYSRSDPQVAATKLRPVSGSQNTERKDIFRHFKYTIIETSPHLIAKQQKLLEDFPGMVSWVSDLNELKPFSGCFLSNELLDAFPVRLVEMNDELMEIYVSADGDNLVEVKMPCGDEVREYFKGFSIKLQRGFRTEVNLRIYDWLKNVSGRLREGFILTVDYGYAAGDYYSEERNRGTLLCYHRHQANENPYQNIGEQDITAHVNFSSLKKWGGKLGLKTLGFCPQGTYLIALGIDEVLAENVTARNEIASPSARNDTRNIHNANHILDAAKIKGLILPGAMGESHKVMAQYKGAGEPALRGFSMRNQEKLL